MLPPTRLSSWGVCVSLAFAFSRETITVQARETNMLTPQRIFEVPPLFFFLRVCAVVPPAKINLKERLERGAEAPNPWTPQFNDPKGPVLIYLSDDTFTTDLSPRDTLCFILLFYSVWQVAVLCFALLALLFGGFLFLKS